MYPVVSALVLIVSVLLIIVVLVQNSKGGGLASNFSGSNSFMGVRKTTDFIEKATWALAISLMLLSFIAVMVLPKGGVQGGGSLIDTQIQNMPKPSVKTPNFPAPAAQQAPAQEPAK